VVLAAGASRRLGTCKALVRLGPRTALEHLLAAGADLGPEPPLVIAGPDFDAIAAAAPRGVRVLANPDWEAGRTGSVAVAVRVLPERDLCLAPVDVPLVPRGVFRALAAAWAAAGSPATGWLAPHVEVESRRRSGHPVVLGRALLQRAATGDPAAALRGFRSFADPIWSIPVAGNEILDDLDDPFDLERLRSRFEAEDPDSPPPSTPQP